MVVDSIGALTAKSSYVKKRESGRIRVGDDNIKEKDEQIGTWMKYGEKNSHDGRCIIRNEEGGIVGVVTRTKGFSNEVDVIMFFNGERHNYTGADTGITMNDSDRDAVEKFVRFAISKHNM
jgi:ABC-type glycerol-3-phosphate transport system substrate-binding protein